MCKLSTDVISTVECGCGWKPLFKFIDEKMMILKSSKQNCFLENIKTFFLILKQRRSFDSKKFITNNREAIKKIKKFCDEKMHLGTCLVCQTVNKCINLAYHNAFLTISGNF